MLSLLVDAAVSARLDLATRRRLRRRLARMLRAAWLTEPTGDELEMSVRLTDDDSIQVLNRDYRHKDRPTDVLAFSQREGVGGALHPELLGDVVVSVDTAQRQARSGLEAELLHLCAHGLCHLLGYDHQTDAQEADMNRRADALLAEARRRGATRPA